MAAPKGESERTAKPRVVPAGTVLPPPRPGTRYVRVRVLGIVISTDELRHDVDRLFHWPMIVLALLVLPLLAVELFAQPAYLSGLWWLVLVGFTVIWLAFTVEFIVKISIAESRLEYVKHNWLDLIIVIIPLLRPLRVASIARSTRVFTLRGVGMKFARYVFTFVLGLEATDRMLERMGMKRAPGRIDPARMTRRELMKELRAMRYRADCWEAWYKDANVHQAEIGQPPLPPAPPDPQHASGRVEKAVACVVRKTDTRNEHIEVLILNHPTEGLQLPRGTVEPCETPEVGVVRELFEESGLTTVQIHAKLGEMIVASEEPGNGTQQPLEVPDDECANEQVWHLFWLESTAPLPDMWEHVAQGEEDAGLIFRFSWLPLEEAVERVGLLYQRACRELLIQVTEAGAPTDESGEQAREPTEEQPS
ncbi:MAG: NUDIX domain-containing protein [Phycisphaerales bacterium]